MSDNQVQFNEWRPAQHSPEEDKTAMARWLIKISGGLIKNQKQANLALLVILAGVIVATILVLVLG